MNIEKLNFYCPIIKDNTRFFYLLFKKIFHSEDINHLSARS